MLHYSSEYQKTLSTEWGGTSPLQPGPNLCHPILIFSCWPLLLHPGLISAIRPSLLPFWPHLCHFDLYLLPFQAHLCIPASPLYRSLTSAILSLSQPSIWKPPTFPAGPP